MTGYEAFSFYNSIKLHITSDSYNYFKYNGKTNITVEAFERRKDKYFFYKLSRKYVNADEYVLFLVANFLENEKVWAGSLLEDEAEQTFRKRQKILQSLSYIFENECRELFDSIEDPNSILKVVDGEYPQLLNHFNHKKISIETICILNNILNFIPMWTKKISDDIFWPTNRKRFIKYTDFVPVDDPKFKTILKKIITK